MYRADFIVEALVELFRQKLAQRLLHRGVKRHGNSSSNLTYSSGGTGCAAAQYHSNLSLEEGHAHLIQHYPEPRTFLVAF